MVVVDNWGGFLGTFGGSIMHPVREGLLPIALGDTPSLIPAGIRQRIPSAVLIAKSGMGSQLSLPIPAITTHLPELPLND